MDLPLLRCQARESSSHGSNVVRWPGYDPLYCGDAIFCAVAKACPIIVSKVRPRQVAQGRAILRGLRPDDASGSIWGVPGEFETCPHWAPTENMDQCSHGSLLKTMRVHGSITVLFGLRKFETCPTWGANHIKDMQASSANPSPRDPHITLYVCMIRPPGDVGRKHEPACGSRRHGSKSCANTGSSGISSLEASVLALSMSARSVVREGGGLTFGMRMRRKQLHTFDHPLLLVIEEPILTRLEAGNDRMPCRRRMLGYMLARRTVTATDVPTTGGDETTNLSMTPGIPHIRRHLVSKRD